SSPHLSGIGVDVLPTSRGLRVVGVFPGSPAARAGLVRGEEIIRVGSTALAGHTAEFDSSLIRGRAGTRVTLTVTTGAQSHKITITRQNIVIPVASGKVVSYRGTKVGDDL